jgi:antitoxin CptB
MNEETSSEILDPRRRRMMYRAWHRGTKELDILLGTFAKNNLATMPDDELDTFEKLMEVPEPDLYKWIAGQRPVPDNYKTPLIDKLIAFHKQGGAIAPGLTTKQ